MNAASQPSSPAAAMSPQSRFVLLSGMQGSARFLRSSVRTEGEKSAVQALERNIELLKSDCDLAPAPSAASSELTELLRKAAVLGQSIDGVLGEMSKAGQVTGGVERISDYLDLMRRLLDEARTAAASGTLSPAAAPTAEPSAEQLTALARQGCGGEDVRWSFSDAGLRRTLNAYAAWAARSLPAGERVYPLPDDLYPGSKDWMASNYAGRVEWLHVMYESKKREADTFIAGVATAAERAAKPVAMAMRDSERGWWLAPVSQQTEDILRLRGVKEGDLLFAAPALEVEPPLSIRRYRMDLDLMGMLEDDQGGWVRFAELYAGAQTDDDWSNEAAQLLASFVSLGASPNPEKWASAAAASARLLNRPADGAGMERLAAIAEEFRRALPTEDGQVLASMIAQGVTVLESHIRYAFATRAAAPLTFEQKEAMHAVVSNAGRYTSGLLQPMWEAAHATAPAAGQAGVAAR